MGIPNPPTNYTGIVDIATVTLTWVNGAGAVEVIHEVSYDAGANWSRLDHDTVPTVTSDHSILSNRTVYLRAFSRNADGDSQPCPPIVVVTSDYVP